MKFTQINYTTAIILWHDQLGSFTNHLGQTFELVRFGLHSPLNPNANVNRFVECYGKIMVLYHEKKLAYLTDFEDPDYFMAKNPLVKAYYFDNYLYFPRLLPELYSK